MHISSVMCKIQSKVAVSKFTTSMNGIKDIYTLWNIDYLSRDEKIKKN